MRSVEILEYGGRDGAAMVGVSAGGVRGWNLMPSRKCDGRRS